MIDKNKDQQDTKKGIDSLLGKAVLSTSKDETAKYVLAAVDTSAECVLNKGLRSHVLKQTPKIPIYLISMREREMDSKFRDYESFDYWIGLDFKNSKFSEKIIECVKDYLKACKSSFPRKSLDVDVYPLPKSSHFRPHELFLCSEALPLYRSGDTTITRFVNEKGIYVPGRDKLYGVSDNIIARAVIRED